MAHAEGWIEAYDILDSGKAVPTDLKAKVLSNRNGIGETMLHWYAIEGTPEVLKKIIDLGFDVNTTNEFLQTPLFDCVNIDKWDVVEILLNNGADPYIKDQNHETVFEHLELLNEQSKINRLKGLINR